MKLKLMALMLGLAVASMQLQGCAVAALGCAMAMCSDAGNKNKASFQLNNTERQKSGLKPLTWDEWNNWTKANDVKARSQIKGR